MEGATTGPTVTRPWSDFLLMDMADVRWCCGRRHQLKSDDVNMSGGDDVRRTPSPTEADDYPAKALGLSCNMQ